MPRNKLSNNRKLIEIFDPVDDIRQKFDFYIKTVLGIFGVTLVVLMVMVATLVIDSFHINSATYREYAERLESLEKDDRQLEAIEKQNEEIKQILERVSNTTEEKKQ